MWDKIKNLVRKWLGINLPEEPQPVERFARPELLPLDGLAPGEVVFAVGNIAQGGRDIMARVRQEGTLYVQ